MAVQYPTYTVAGVALDDPSGRWELIPGTSLLPSFPGRRVSNIVVPGQVGSRTAAYAPTESSTFALKVRFNAVEGTARTFVKGAGRARAITNNINLFMQATALARTGYLGLVEVRRKLSSASADQYKCSARVTASTEPEFDPYKDYAEMTFIFDNPAGVWRSLSSDITELKHPGIVKGSGTKRMIVPMGTAPIINSFIAFKGPHSGSPRIAVNNGHSDQGFRIGMPGKTYVIASGRWAVVNTLSWRLGSDVPVSGKTGSNAVPWSCSKPGAGYLEPQGRPMGSALSILPEATPGTGWVHVYSNVPITVVIRSTKTWY